MMASGVSTMSPKHRHIASLLAACMLLLLAASPAFGYNEEIVKHTRVSRLDPVQCATPIRLVADLTDKHGNAVSGAEVNWSFHKTEPGDTLNSTTTFADAEGRARTTLTLACETGTRIIRAHVPGDGTGQITISCKLSTNCAEEDDEGDKHVMRLTLERLDPISCTSTMRFRAMVYDENDNPIRDVAVKFDADEKEDGDKLTPKRQKTDIDGTAITYLDMSCGVGAREIVAKADGKQRRSRSPVGSTRVARRTTIVTTRTTTTTTSSSGSQIVVAAPGSRSRGPVPMPERSVIRRPAGRLPSTSRPSSLRLSASRSRPGRSARAASRSQVCAVPHRHRDADAH